MNRLSMRMRFCAIAGIGILVFLSILLEILPANWIELRLGIDPDSGSGLLEFLLVLTPLLIAMAITSLLLDRPQSASGDSYCGAQNNRHAGI
jgi:hypothetical protein